MESNQKPFKLEVKLSNGFSFNFNTLDQETSKFRTKEAKKKSPSTIRRNAARKQEFLDKKKISSVDNELSEISLKCDQCDFKVNCKVKLRKHIEKEHKVIPQLDGVNDNNHSEERSSQTEKEHTVIPQLDGLVNLSSEAMKEEPAAFEMGTDGYPKVKPIDPEVTPPQRVFHPDLGVGDNAVQTELWKATWWQYTFHNFRGSGEDFQRRIYVVKKNSL